MFKNIVILLLVFFIGAYTYMTYNDNGDESAKEGNETVTLVRTDGSYPVKPLEKDTIVVKVVQSGVKSLADFATVQQGLDYNLSHMLTLGKQACEEGKKPDFMRS